MANNMAANMAITRPSVTLTIAGTDARFSSTSDCMPAAVEDRRKPAGIFH